MTKIARPRLGEIWWKQDERAQQQGEELLRQGKPALTCLNPNAPANPKVPTVVREEYKAVYAQYGSQYSASNSQEHSTAPSDQEGVGAAAAHDPEEGSHWASGEWERHSEWNRGYGKRDAAQNFEEPSGKSHRRDAQSWSRGSWSHGADSSAWHADGSAAAEHPTWDKQMDRMIKQQKK